VIGQLRIGKAVATLEDSYVWTSPVAALAKVLNRLCPVELAPWLGIPGRAAVSKAASLFPGSTVKWDSTRPAKANGVY